MSFKVGAGISLDGEKEFKAAAADIERSLKVLASQAKRNSIVFSDNANVLKKHQAQSETLSAQVKVQRDKIAVLTAALESAKREYGENSKQVDNWKIKLNNAEGVLFKMEKALNENEDALRKLTKGNAAKSMHGFAGIVENIKDKFRKTKQEIDKTHNSLKKAGKGALTFGDALKANVIGSAITSGLKAVGSLLGKIARKFTDFVKSGVENASNLSEVQNVVSTTFKSSAKEIDKFAKSAAASYGMSELSAKKYSGTMGAMLKSMKIGEKDVTKMSTSMVGLAGDMASFYNLEHDVAFEKIRAGISGETEPLKQLGINMSVANLQSFALEQGITKSYKSMTAAEQATLRYNYLMSATADAQGDFAKTSGSYANQQKILKLNLENIATSVGSKLIPALTQGSTAINGMLSGTMSIDEGLDVLSGVITQSIDSVIKEIPKFLKVGSKIVNTVVGGILQNADSLITSAVDMVFVLVRGLTTEENIQNIINAAVTLITTVVSGLINNVDVLITAAFTIVDSLVYSLIDEKNLAKLIESALRLVIELAAGIIRNIPRMYDAAKKLVRGVFKGIWENRHMAVEAIVKVGKAMLDAILDYFGIKGDSSTVFAGLGKNLGKGIVNGITNMKDWLVSKIKKLGSVVTDALKEVWDIHSPSRVTEGDGVNLALGVGIGWEKGIKKILGKIKSSSKDLSGSINTSLKVVEKDDFNYSRRTYPRSSSAPRQTIINIKNFYARTDEEAERSIDEVSRKLAQKIDEEERAYA